MRIVLALACLLVLLQGCGQDSTLTAGLSLPNTSSPYLNATGPNVMPLRIGGSGLCGSEGYINELCTSVTICMPGTDQCKTVSDILLDTGSVGLRVFPSALGFSLPVNKTPDGGTAAACTQFGTGSDWGPLAAADVGLGGEPRVRTVIQLINQNVGTVPAGCTDTDTNPQQAGYNGILGIGLFTTDCGTLCARLSDNGIYFNCPASASGDCSGATIPESEQLANPAALLPIDNNGILIALPQIGAGGATAVTGVLVLGIGTQPNNQPQGVKGYLTDRAGDFTAIFQGTSYPGSFIDSGSNAYFFPNDANLPSCDFSGPRSHFYCPSEAANLTATNEAEDGSRVEVPFQVAPADKLFDGDSVAFANLGGLLDTGFDWGVPFFFGRAVFVGFEKRSSSLGTGPYFGY